MTQENEFELVEGTGNVFRDSGDSDAVLKHAKAVLAADVIGELDSSGLTVRKAAAATGFAAADFSRVRNANLGRFTIDQLVRMAAALRGAAGSLECNEVGKRAAEGTESEAKVNRLQLVFNAEHKPYLYGAIHVVDGDIANQWCERPFIISKRGVGGETFYGTIARVLRKIRAQRSN